MYQIHEVCERCHLSRKAIRLYEEKDSCIRIGYREIECIIKKM